MNNNKEIIFDVDKVIGNIENIKTLSTGYKELDFAIKGIRKGELYVVASKAVKGKICLLNNILYNMINEKDLNVLYFCLTEHLDSLIKKLVAIDTSISLEKINFEELNMLLNEEFKAKIEQSLKKFKNKKIKLCTNQDTNSIYDISIEEKPDVIFIDQFQNIKFKVNYSNGFYEDLHNQCHILKKITETLDIPVIIGTNISNKLKDEEFESYDLLNIYDAGFNLNEIDSAIFCLKETDIMNLKVINIKSSRNFIFKYKFNPKTLKINENI